jgi:hypothetical protein
MHAIGYLDTGDQSKAASNFNRSFANSQPPFGMWTETPTGGAVNFITGAGGFLQGVVFGYPGLRLLHEDNALQIKPILIEGATHMKLRGIHYQNSILDISYNSSIVDFTLVHSANPASIYILRDLITGKVRQLSGTVSMDSSHLFTIEQRTQSVFRRS